MLTRDPGVVVVATGARPRVPDVPGVDLPQVVTSVAALTGTVRLGDGMIVISEDDRAAPLAVADHLAGAGHQVTLVYQSPAPSPQVGKYSIGSVLARLDADGVRLVPMARAVAFRPGAVELAHSYSDRRWTLDGADTVVLACGSVSDDALYHELRTRHPACTCWATRTRPGDCRSRPARRVTWSAPYSPRYSATSPRAAAGWEVVEPAPPAVR